MALASTTLCRQPRRRARQACGLSTNRGSRRYGHGDALIAPTLPEPASLRPTNMDAMRPASRLLPALALLWAAPAALGQSPAGPAPAGTGKAEVSAPARPAPSPALTASVAVPRPLAEEMRHTARLDAAIQPLRDYPLTPPEAAHLRAALAASASGKAAEAL